MSVERVREYLKRWNKHTQVRELAQSSATVELAALAVGVEGARIAKSIALKNNQACILLVTSGDARVDNRKFQTRFAVRAKMLKPEETFAFTGYAVGGVCPFAIDNPLVRIYLDVSLQRFDTVFPACGSANSAIELSCGELYACSQAAGWVDVCRLPE